MLIIKTRKETELWLRTRWLFFFGYFLLISVDAQGWQGPQQTASPAVATRNTTRPAANAQPVMQLLPAAWRLQQGPAANQSYAEWINGGLNLLRSGDFVQYPVPRLVPGSILELEYRTFGDRPRPISITLGEQLLGQFDLPSTPSDSPTQVVRILLPDSTKARDTLRLQVEPLPTDRWLLSTLNPAHVAAPLSTRLISTGPLRGTVSARSEFRYGDFAMGGQFFSAAAGEPLFQEGGNVVLAPASAGAWRLEQSTQIKRVRIRVAGDLEGAQDLEASGLLEPLNVPPLASQVAAFDESYPVTETRRVEMFGRGTIGVVIQLHNRSSRPRSHRVELTGGGEAWSPESAAGDLAATLPDSTPSGQASTGQPLTNSRQAARGLDGIEAGLWQPYERIALPNREHRWMLVRNGDRIAGHPVGVDETEAPAVRQPAWIVGWDAASSTSDSPPLVELQGSRYAITFRQPLAPGEQRELRIACGVAEEVKQAELELQAWLEGRAPEQDEPAEDASELSPISWSSSDRQLDELRQRATRELLGSFDFDSPVTDAAIAWIGDGGGELRWEERALLGAELSWVDPQRAQAWLQGSIAAEDDLRRLQAELGVVANRLPMRLAATTTGLAEAAWHHVLVTGDTTLIQNSFERLSSNTLDASPWELSRVPGGVLVSGNASTISLEQQFAWLSEARTMERIAVRLERNNDVWFWQRAVQGVENLLAIDAAGSAREIRSPNEPNDFWRAWRAVNGAQALGRDALTGPSDELSWHQSWVSKQSGRWWRWALWSVKQTSCGGERVENEHWSLLCWDWLVRSGELSEFAFESQASRGVLQQLADDQTRRLPANQLAIEVWGGLVLKSNGEVWISPARSSLKCCRFEIANFRGRRLEVEWNSMSTAQPLEGQLSPNDSPFPQIPPGLRVHWGEERLIDQAEFDPTMDAVKLFSE